MDERIGYLQFDVKYSTAEWEVSVGSVNKAGNQNKTQHCSSLKLCGGHLGVYALYFCICLNSSIMNSILKEPKINKKTKL